MACVLFVNGIERDAAAGQAPAAEGRTPRGLARRRPDRGGCVRAGGRASSGGPARRLRSISVALARVEVQPLGGSLVSARAFGPDGTPVPLSVSAGRLLPRRLLTPGESVTVVTVVRRPGWLGWALGHTRTERLTVRAPLPQLSQRWLTVAAHAPLRLRFASRSTGSRTGAAGGRGSSRPESASSRSGLRRRRARSRCRAHPAPGSASAHPSASPGFRRPGCRPCSSDLPRRGTISPRAPIELTFCEAAAGRARRRAAAGFARASRAIGARATATRSSSRPSGFGFPLNCRRCASVAAQPECQSRELTGDDSPHDRLAGRRRELPPSAAAACRRRLPPAQLAARGGTAAAAAARGDQRRGHPAGRDVHVALPEHAAASCNVSGSSGSRTRSCAVR